MSKIYCPRCEEDINIIEFDKYKFDIVCGFCGFNATYENVDKSAILLREMVDDIQKRAEKEIKASPVDWSKSRSYPMPSEDQIVKGGSND